VLAAIEIRAPGAGLGQGAPADRLADDAATLPEFSAGRWSSSPADARHASPGHPDRGADDRLARRQRCGARVFRQACWRRRLPWMFHNHPSGDPQPSAEDVELSRRMVAAGRLMGIEVIDHVVLGDGRYCSLKESGYL
jgi:hypothetical protein